MTNAIVPKFKVGQKVWCVGYKDTVVSFLVDGILININNQGYNIIYNEYGFEGIPEQLIFATREEADKTLVERGAQ